MAMIYLACYWSLVCWVLAFLMQGAQDHPPHTDSYALDILLAPIIYLIIPSVLLGSLIFKKIKSY